MAGRDVLGVAVAVALIAVAPASAHLTTEEHTITGDAGAAYSQLETGEGWERVVREDLAPARPGRQGNRESLTYFGQLTDFQLSDEESPARVELFDIDGTPFTAAWRPQEALVAFMADQAIRALNDNVTSPHSTGAAMDFSLVTGDQADSNQRNEVEWVVRLLEGGPITPNSGVEDNLPTCGANGEAAGYTGVQDYDDYEETDAFYDPDVPMGKWSAWPLYPGLMDAAQRGFQAEGSAVPTYVTNGNHDMLAQGNAWSNAAYEAVATGCVKHSLPMPFSSPTPTALQTQPQNSIVVPADPARQYVNRPQIRELHDTGAQGDAHGFAYVDPEELEASNNAASYYAFSPADKPWLRLISIDTLSEAGIPGPSANGSIDDPQFQWLKRELDDAEAEGDLVIVYGHHPIRSLNANLPDELAPPCVGNDPHGHDVNPGCDQDRRSSSPIRLGEDFKNLLLAHKGVIAYVAGHTHEHNIDAFGRPDGSGGFWAIETSSIVDWPVQARVIEVVDNRDDTLSIFGTIIDHEGPITAPDSGTPASTFDPATMASVGRTLAFNDPQAGGGTGEGAAEDRNVELLLPDPRCDVPDPGPGCQAPGPGN